MEIYVFFYSLLLPVSELLGGVFFVWFMKSHSCPNNTVGVFSFWHLLRNMPSFLHEYNYKELYMHTIIIN